MTGRGVHRLIRAAGARLAMLDHDMAQDVARRLDRAIGTAAPGSLRRDAQSVPGCRALGALIDGRPNDPLVDAVRAAKPDLPWQEAPRELSPETFAGAHAFVELVGPDGLVPADRLRMGLFLLCPEVFYPSHRHDAEELYLVLAGAGAWQLGGALFAGKGPGDSVHIPSGEAHAIATAQSGVLSLWAWRGEIGFESYRYL